MKNEDYVRIVRETVDRLPEQFREHLKDVSIVIEERAPGRGARSLLGLYEGVPLTEWGRGTGGEPSDKITLYRLTIEEEAETPEDIPHIVRETLLHEIAHFFGFEHDRIEPMEERWRSERLRSLN